MAHIFVIAGHGAGDPGAGGNGYNEYERVRALAKELKRLGGDEVSLGDLNRNYYADKGINTLDIPKSWQILELHLDSAAASARGGHVIIKTGFKPDKYDEALAKNISAIFPGRSSTIVNRGNLGNVNRAAARGYSYRLLEVCFITNSADMQIFNNEMERVAKAILESFDIPVSGGGSNVDPAPDPTPEPAPAPAPSPAPSGSSSFGGTYKCMVNKLNVRSAPSTSSSVVASYSKGQTVKLDNWYKIADGYVWGRYTGAQSGKLRYVAVGKPTGGPDPNDYLVKI